MFSAGQTVLKRGTTVYLSQVGHKNFSYPSENCKILSEDTGAERLHWTGGGSKIAYAVSAEVIFPEWKSNTKVCVWVENEQPVGIEVITLKGE